MTGASPQTAAKRQSKKEKLAILWRHVRQRPPPYVTDNDEIRRVVPGGNQFDLTKIDSRRRLPTEMVDDDVCLVHLGNGRHEFINGIDRVYRLFDPSPPPVVRYFQPGALHQIDRTREAGLLSTLFNERVFHEFLYQDIKTEARVHLPGRKKAGSFAYKIGPSTRVEVSRLQVELDFILEATLAERPLDVSVAEAKIGSAPDFNVSQLYLPYRFLMSQQGGATPRFTLRPLFVRQYPLRTDASTPGLPPGNHQVTSLYEYRFEDPEDLASIRFVGARSYYLEPFGPRQPLNVPLTGSFSG